MFKNRVFLGFLTFLAFTVTGFAMSGKVWSEVTDNVAYVHHDDAWFNCCPDSIFDIQRHADTIDIYEIDNGSHPCRCMCYFDFTHRIEGLEPGTYLARVWEKQPGEEPELAGETSFAIPVLVGAFDIVHHMSPCHEGVGEDPANDLVLKAPSLATTQTEVNIRYWLPKATNTVLTIYDVTGVKVRTLLEGVEEAGEHLVRWDVHSDEGKPVPQGVYFVRLEAAGQARTLSVIVLR